jgi:hypothetical protein
MFVRNAFLADKVSLDASWKVSALGIFDTIFGAKFPAKHGDLTLVAKLEGTAAEKGDHKFSVEFRDVKGNKLGSYERMMSWRSSQLGSNILKTNVILEVRGLLIPKPGEYEFVMFLDDRFLGRVPLTVQQIHIKTEGEA